MTISVPTAATANEDDLKLTIVNPKNLYDPSPNGWHGGDRAAPRPAGLHLRTGRPG